MIDLFQKMPKQQKPQFSMPQSLRIIRECAKENIDWRNLHYVDLLSIIYSIRIDYFNRWLETQRNEKLHKHGVESIKQASSSDFNNL